MEHIGYILGKNIQLPNYLGMLVEGEDLTEYITLKMKKDETLEGLNYYLTYKNADGAGDTFALTKEITDREILLSFVVTNAFTAVKGKMEIQVNGFEVADDPAEDDPVWKSFVSTIVIARSLHPEEIQPDTPTIFVTYLSQMQTLKEAAETAQGKAEDAQEAAETAQGKAEDAQEAAETAQGKAETAQTAAEGYATSADNARIVSVSETISPDDGGTNVITFTYKDGTVKTFTVTNGHTGAPFAIYKTYSSVAEMNADLANVPEGKFVIITSNTEDPDNAKLYVRGSSAFTFITDLSGAQGIQGPDGIAASIQVGTVTTGQPGTQATVTNSGTTSAAVLDFTIPRGNTGATGPGVPSGGTTGKVLKKKSNTDYDTEWASEQDISGKADKVSGATSGHLAGLDGNGNLTDSNIPANNIPTSVLADRENVAIIPYLEAKVNSRPFSPELSVSYPDSIYGTGVVPSNVVRWSEVRKVYGKTRAWNQLVKNGNFSDTSGWLFSSATGSVSSNVCTVTPTGSNGQIYQNFNFVKGHKYLVSVDINLSTANSNTRLLVNSDPVASSYASSATGWQTVSVIQASVNDVTNGQFIVRCNSGNVPFDVRNFHAHNLTLIFGAGNEPSTVADALAQLPALGEYNAYDAGSLVDTTYSGVKSVGRNLFNINDFNSINGYFNGSVIASSADRKIVYVPCKPNTIYCATRKAVVTNERFSFGFSSELPAEGVSCSNIVSATSSQTIGATMTITATSPSDAKYLVCWAYWDNTTSALDSLCINISDSQDGTYTPYKTDTLSLPETVTLKSAGSVSDELDVESGVITRKVDTVTYDGSSDELWGNVVPVGTNGLYRGDIVISNNQPNDSAVVCDKFATLSFNNRNYNEISVMMSANDQRLYICNNTFTDSPSLKTWIASNNFTITFVKATPTTESITSVDAFLEVEPRGSVSMIQENDPEIDTKFDMGYLQI